MLGDESRSATGVDCHSREERRAARIGRSEKGKKEMKREVRAQAKEIEKAIDEA